MREGGEGGAAWRRVPAWAAQTWGFWIATLHPQVVALGPPEDSAASERLPHSKDSLFAQFQGPGLRGTHTHAPVKAVNDSVCGTRDEESEGLRVLNWSLRQFDRCLEVGRGHDQKGSAN